MPDSTHVSSQAGLVVTPKPRGLQRLADLGRHWVWRALAALSEAGTAGWSAAPSSRLSLLVCRLALALTVSAFLAYFGMLCFRQAWSGDFQLYCAAVSRLYEDLLTPSHETLAVPGTESFAYSPYLVAVGALGKLFGASPYRALQGAGVVNLALFSAGASYFFSRHSIHRRWELPTACFLFVTLFVRWKHFGWSSETSLVTMQYLQAYPSTIGWGLAFFALGLVKGVAEEGRRPELIALAGVAAVLMLTHALTASWTVGILGLYALYTALRRRDHRPLTRTLLALVLGLCLALLWPYSPLLGQSSLVSAPERSPFGKSPFLDVLNLYCLALPCAAYLILRLRRHEFWLLGFLATLGALTLWRKLGFNYGNRYAFFAAFFAQLMLAEVMAIGLFALFRPLVELSPQRKLWWLDRPLAVLVLLAALPAWLPSPMWKQWGAGLQSPVALLEQPSPDVAYNASLPELRRLLSTDDVVLMPAVHFAFDVAALTGARFVSAPYIVRVHDRYERDRDVRAFFAPAVTKAERALIAERYGVTKVLILDWQFVLLGELTELLGEPLSRDRTYALFDAKALGR